MVAGGELAAVTVVEGREERQRHQERGADDVRDRRRQMWGGVTARMVEEGARHRMEVVGGD